MKGRILVGWSLAVLVCATMSPAAWGATTWYVGGDEADLKTIQAAVDVAVDGDTVVLQPGTYGGPGNCDVDLKGKAIAIQSTNPADANVVETTILDCAGSDKAPHRAFSIPGCNGVVISGLTITKGLASAGGALYCQNSTVDLMYSRILDNTALPGAAGADLNGGPGGGLYCENSIVRVVGCLISGNTAGNGASSKDGRAGAGGNGGGICGVKSDISVASTTVSGNAAGSGGDGGQGAGGNGGDGGGLFGNSIRVIDSAVSFNSAGGGGPGVQTGRGGRGGGLCAETAVLDRCVIEANRAGAGGSAFAGARNSRDLVSGGDGGGIYSDSLEITNSLVAGNRAGRGYALDLSGSLAHGNGGGVWCVTGVARQCTIVGNVVCSTEAGAGADVSSSAGPGAGVFSTPEMVIAGSIVYENTPDQLAGHDCRNVAYCNIEAGRCPSDQGNVSEKPMFVRSGTWAKARDPNVAAGPDDPEAVWRSGDYHLRAASPCLDAGDPNYIPGLDEADVDGNPRLADTAIDIGACEFQSLVPVYRFWSPVTGKHFFTRETAEKDKLISRYGNVWTFEGPAYYAYARAVEPNLLPVYRFWSETLASHFYTISEAEKDKLVTEFATTWMLEGPAFYAYAEGRQPAGTKPVYRFWSDTLAGHFYTISEAEKDKLVAEFAHVWMFEGIAWYAYETPRSSESAVYEFSGGPEEALCTVNLKAYIDGKEAKIDKPSVVFAPHTGYMRVTVDLVAMTTTLHEFLVESDLVSHAAIIGEDGSSLQIPIVLSSAIHFWARTPRGPFSIDPQTLAFPAKGGAGVVGENDAFGLGGSVTVDSRKLDVGLAVRATHFAVAGQGTFDNTALPDRLSVRMPGTFQWSRSQPDLLLETAVKGSVLQLYIASVQIRTMGSWQGKLSP